jgi:hypothetical protein
MAETRQGLLVDHVVEDAPEDEPENVLDFPLGRDGGGFCALPSRPAMQRSRHDSDRLAASPMYLAYTSGGPPVYPAGSEREHSCQVFCRRGRRGPPVRRHGRRYRAVPGGGHLDHATGRGHALIGRALYLPEVCAADEEHRELAGILGEVMFASKPQLVDGPPGKRALPRDPRRLRHRR